MKNITKIFLSFCLTAGVSGCHKDLNLQPQNDITADVVYSTPEGYKMAFAKIYGSFALTGGAGSGSSDLGGIDAGTSDFLRLYWNAQELTTDEAACAWVGDPGVSELNFQNWNSNNVMLRGLYTRSLYQITVANEFLRESTEEKLASRNITGADAGEISVYREEARFLRAYQYWVLMDLFGNPPFITEESGISKTAPPRITRTELFSYVESELLDIESKLVAPRQNEYGRADQGAVWALLTRLYMNAEVYLGTGNAKYTQAITYADKVIGAGYALETDYQKLFIADNDKDNRETILSINYDAINTQNYGGTTFIINSSVNNAMNPASFGIPNGGWGGNRSRATLPGAFGELATTTDKRAMFFGQTSGIEDMSVFTEGLAVGKFKNTLSDGTTAPSNDGTQCSVDFPLFRLADIYLLYAEAVLRGGNGGSNATALEYVNQLRARAYGNNSGNVTSLSLDFMLEERMRELHWEAYRRTDLIRFGKYTGDSYLWPFKGGVPEGTSIPAYRTVFPIPASDIIANPNLLQNDNY